MADYKDTIIDTLIQSVKNILPDNYFRAYFYGDPIDIPTSLLPCIIFDKEETHVTQDATGVDRVTYMISVRLAYNKKDDFGKSPTEIVGKRAIEQYIEGRDPVTGGYHSQSICGMFRTQFTQGNILVDQNLHVRYGVVPRPQNTLTAEGEVKCEMTELVMVPVRT